jgi:hypothetical protein
MTESGAKVVIRGDAKHAVQEAKKVEDAVDNIGKKGKSAGDVLGKMGDQLAKAVVKAVALQTALAGVAEWQKRQSDTAAGSRSRGKSVIERDQAAAKLGLNAQQAAALTTPGAQSRDDLTGFLSTLASGDNARFLGQEGIFQAQALFNSGAYSKDEVMSAVREGRVPQLMRDMPRRLAAMTPEGVAHLEAMREENILAARKEDALDANGMGNRLAEARIAARNAEHPIAGGIQGAVSNGLGSLPIIGPGIGAGINAADTSANNQGAGDLGYNKARLTTTNGRTPGGDIQFVFDKLAGAIRGQTKELTRPAVVGEVK